MDYKRKTSYPLKKNSPSSKLHSGPITRYRGNPNAWGMVTHPLETLMDLTDLIETFNDAHTAKIEHHMRRDGSVWASLPRLAVEILVRDGAFTDGVRVSPRDLALLIKEVKLAMAPAFNLLNAGLDGLEAGVPTSQPLPESVEGSTGSSSNDPEK